MSPNVGNFVHDLVEMAKAMETLPQVERSLEEAQLVITKLQDRLGEANADLEQSRTYAATLEQKVRTVEAERDDAEIRFLEVEEKTTKALASIEAAVLAIGTATDCLVPPKPQPEPVQPPITEVVQSIEPQPQGQSEAVPTQDTITGDTFQQTQASVNVTASPSENVTSSETTAEAPKPSGPYTGKRYIDVPYYVSHEDWLAGGGSHEDYYIGR